MSTITHNKELLQLIKTLETYVLNDAQLREVYNKNKNQSTSFRKSLELIEGRIYPAEKIPNQTAKSSLLAKIKQANSKYNTGTNTSKFLTENERKLLKNILRYEMLQLFTMSNNQLPPNNGNTFLKHFNPKQTGTSS